MSATLIYEREVTARKPHSCANCNAATIQPGEQYMRQVYAYDGTVYTWITCPPCRDLFHLVYTWVDPLCDEGIDIDDYAEWAREHVDHPDDGPAARAYLERRFPQEGTL